MCIRYTQNAEATAKDLGASPPVSPLSLVQAEPGEEKVEDTTGVLNLCEGSEHGDGVQQLPGLGSSASQTRSSEGDLQGVYRLKVVVDEIATSNLSLHIPANTTLSELRAELGKMKVGHQQTEDSPLNCSPCLLHHVASLTMADTPSYSCVV